MTATLPTAIHHFHAGRLDEARRLCLVGLVHDPAHATTFNLLGVCLFNGGRPHDAVPMLTRTLRLQPDLTDALTNLSVALQTVGRSEDAAARLRHLLVLQPASGLALDQLGGLLNQAGDLDGAIRLLTRAARLNPESLQGRVNLALIRHAAGRLPAAVAGLRGVAASAPNAVGVYSHLGAVLLGAGDVLGAQAAFGRARTLDPGHQDAANGLARVRRYLEAARAALDPGVRPGVVVRGPMTPVSGYGHMACRLLEQMQRRGMAVHTVGLFGAEQWPGTDAPVRARVALHCLIPPAVEPVPGLRTAVFSMFEGPRIPASWKHFSDRHDVVIVPCRWSRDAWMAQGYPEERIRICPLGVDAAPSAGPVLALADRRGRPVSSYRHRILNISDFIPRKNVDGLLRVWLRATRADDDAVLILKLGKGNAASRQAIEALIRCTEQEVGRRLDEAASVVVLDHRLSEEEMDGLYRASTHYWSLSHGEGWDLPLTRAGAFGLGLVAPRHSAYEDYLDETVARLIPARVVPAFEPYGRRYYPPFHGLEWWQPDEDAAAAVIGDLVRGRCDAFPDARARLLGRFTWDQASDRLFRILDEAGL